MPYCLPNTICYKFPCYKKKYSYIKEKRFLYDIVANGRNGIDVDK